MITRSSRRVILCNNDEKYQAIFQARHNHEHGNNFSHLDVDFIKGFLYIYSLSIKSTPLGDETVIQYRVTLPIVVAVLTFFVLTFTAAAETVYDIQCACYKNRKNATPLVQRLRELNLPWYTIPMKRSTRFILDLNVTSTDLKSFMEKYPEFVDAFLVEDYWNLPHPQPDTIDPLPPRDRFITVMAPYMQQQYKKGYYNRKRLSMSSERAEMYTGFIYDASSYYELDPFLLFAVGNFETYFRNMYGDLDRFKFSTPDPAQGIFQILKSTCHQIYRDMKRKDVPHAPAEPPTNFLRLPKTQVYFAAHYLHNLHRQQLDNRYMALLAYNSSHLKNYDYACRVMRFYQRAVNHYMELSSQLRAKAPIPASLQKRHAVTATTVQYLQ